jgi:hypothetical protein
MDHGVEDGSAAEAEGAKFALGYGVVGALGGEEVDGVFFAGTGRSRDARAEGGHDVELSAALLAIKAANVWVGEDQFEESGPKSSPAGVKFNGKRDQAARHNGRAFASGKLRGHGLPFRGDPGFVSCEKDFALVAEMLVKGARGIARLVSDLVGVGAVIANTIE